MNHMKKSIVKIHFIDTHICLKAIKRKNVVVKGFREFDQYESLPEHFTVNIYTEKTLTFEEQKKPLKEKVKNIFKDNEEPLTILIEKTHERSDYSSHGFYSIYCKEVRINPYLNCITCS